ncbi:MAG TPA: neutral/alkaline non-lysosomal ceramidase N-terminal domain-containing protein [Mycobacteriales bacterium]|nr:neutral/alkaline non-lysosomal ceramidase N-terminal domain-containing protein [Mycobacteriales bacterium]
MTQAAFGTVEITPPLGVPMGGNVRADRAARGVHDPLLASIMIVDSVVLISCDLLSISAELSTPVKESVSARLGIPADHVIVFATHTHSGPQIVRDTPTVTAEPGTAWESWMREVPARIAAAAVETGSRLQPARLDWNSTTVTGLSFNRRLRLHSGATAMNFERPDPEGVREAWGPVDEELIVLRIADEQGRPLGALVHFTLHPAVLVGEQWLLSRDFVGPLVRTVQDSLGAVPVLFANGAEGNINHLDYRLGRQGDPFAEIERIGARLGAAAISALESARPVADPEFGVAAAPVQLRQRPITPEMLAGATETLERSGGRIPSLTDGVPPEAYAAWLLRRAEDYQATVDVRPIVARLGEVTFAFVPGEAFVEFGRSLRRNHPQPVRVVALADASIGYLPTEAAFGQGGYEVTFGTSTIAPGEGERLFNVIDDAVSGL